MSTEVLIFYPALIQAINRQAVLVQGATVGECLDDMARRFPAAQPWIFDSRGQMLDYVFVYINAESARKAPLSDPVSPGDKLILALMVSGG